MNKDCLDIVATRASQSFEDALYNKLKPLYPNLNFKTDVDTLDPNLFVLAKCSNIKIHLGSIYLDNNQMSIVILVFDFISMMILLFTYHLIEYMLNDFAKTYDT